jgi:hypothetical protein
MGGPSLIMAFMYSDHRRSERERLEAAKAEGVKQAQAVEDRARAEARHQRELAEFKQQMALIIAQQERRFEAVVRNYENNVLLVENYYFPSSVCRFTPVGVKYRLIFATGIER